MKIGSFDLSSLDRRWIFAVPGAVLVILFAWAAMPTAGEEVLLRTAPIDPPDLFRGDYVELGYDISTVEKWRSMRGWAVEGDTIYVYLDKRGDWDADRNERFWVVDTYSTQREPQLERDMVCLRGTVESVRDDSMTVRYGIEQYFINKDETLEDWQNAEVAMVVAAKNCQARIISAHVDGTRWP